MLFELTGVLENDLKRVALCGSVRKGGPVTRIVTIIRRDGYNLQTGFGRVRIAPFEGDQMVSVDDLLENFPPEKVVEVLQVVKQHAERQRVI